MTRLVCLLPLALAACSGVTGAGDAMSGKSQPRLSMVILAVDDVEKIASFYGLAFGWPRRVDEPVLVEFALPDGRGVALYQERGFAANTGRKPTRFSGYGTTSTELYFRCEDLAACIARLTDAGARLLAERTPKPWGDEVAYFADPEGNVLAVGAPLAEDYEPAAAGGVVLVKERMVHAPAAEVFAAWTTDEGVKTFLAPQALVEARVGGAFEMYFSPDAPRGSRGSEGCTILALEPDTHLAFTWNFPPLLPAIRYEYTRVDLWLEAVGEDATRVLVKQTGWRSGPEWQQGLQYFEQAWELVLDRLVSSFRFGPVDWDRR